MKAEVILSISKHPYVWEYESPGRIRFRNNENKLVGKYFLSIGLAHAYFDEDMTAIRIKFSDEIDDVGRAIYFCRLKGGFEK